MMKTDLDTAFLPNSKTCFVCGEDNAAGLQTRFYVEKGVVKTKLRPHAHHCGYAGIVHGGVVAAILDECMGWAASRVIKRMCYTGELTIRYLKPISPEGDFTVCTEVKRASRLLAHVEGRIEDAHGEVYARSEGRFLPLSVEETLKVDDQLNYRGGEERVFDALRDPNGGAQAAR
jgi:uncharacterized protein (TIGR00369 family)